MTVSLKFDKNAKKWYNVHVAEKGGNKILMKKDDKASISLKKVISVSIILLFIMGIGVMAASSKLNSYGNDNFGKSTSYVNYGYCENC